MDNKESLLNVLIQRLWGFAETDRSISAVIKLCCIVEGIWDRRDQKKENRMEFKRPEGFWSDENEIFNSYSNILDVLGPIAFYVPSCDSREAATISYKRYSLFDQSILALSVISYQFLQFYHLLHFLMLITPCMCLYLEKLQDRILCSYSFL